MRLQPKLGAAQARGALCAALFAAIASAFLALSCAAPLKIGASIDPLALLEPGALAYARLSGASARDLAPALLPASELASMKSLLERTRILALGMGSSSPSEGIAAAPTAFQAMDFQAALIGNYPFRAAALSFGASPEWKREKSAYYNARLGLRAAVPGPQLVLASSGPIEPLLAAAKRPGGSPIPGRLSELSARELVLWAPEPFSGLAAAMLGETMEVPARGLLIAASPLVGAEGLYEATVVFLMDDANSVRIYRSALKLAWYGMARILFGGDADAALALPSSAEGELFLVSGIRLSRESLVRLLSALRKGPGQ